MPRYQFAKNTKYLRLTFNDPECLAYDICVKQTNQIIYIHYTTMFHLYGGIYYGILPSQSAPKNFLIKSIPLYDPRSKYNFFREAYSRFIIQKQC